MLAPLSMRQRAAIQLYRFSVVLPFVIQIWQMGKQLEETELTLVGVTYIQCLSFGFQINKLIRLKLYLAVVSIL